MYPTTSFPLGGILVLLMISDITNGITVVNMPVDKIIDWPEYKAPMLLRPLHTIALTGSDKSEVYEIIRDENSGILELRKFGSKGKLGFRG
jgi:hypothetical protein